MLVDLRDIPQEDVRIELAGRLGYYNLRYATAPGQKRQKLFGDNDGVAVAIPAWLTRVNDAIALSHEVTQSCNAFLQIEWVYDYDLGVWESYVLFYTYHDPSAVWLCTVGLPDKNPLIAVADALSRASLLALRKIQNQQSPDDINNL